MAVEVRSPPIVPRPYPARTSKLPWGKDEVTPQWLTSAFQNKSPGVVAKALEGMAHMHSDLWNSPLLDQPWLPVSMATPHRQRPDPHHAEVDRPES